MLGRAEEVAMKNVGRYRAMGSLCRQQAAYHPDQSWKLLAQAMHWEHLAEVEMASHFEESNTDRSSDLAKSGITPNPNDTPWTTIAAA